MHSTAKSTGKRTLKKSGKMIERGRSFKGSTGNSATKEVRGISQKRKGKKTKRYEGYWNIIFHWNPADGTSQ